MNFQQLPLTVTEMIFNLTNAARPRFVLKLNSEVLSSTRQRCSDNHIKFKQISALYCRSFRFKRKSVLPQPTGLLRPHRKLNNFCRIQKFKILSSDLLGLVYSSLMQSRNLCTSALLEWYMHNQETDLQATSVRWVTVEKCAELVGWSKDAINALRVKGKIRMDVHWIKRNGRIFIDMAAFQQWIGTGK
jgi:hypothetical protein